MQITDQERVEKRGEIRPPNLYVFVCFGFFFTNMETEP